jgi:hypothetical protein
MRFEMERLVGYISDLRTIALQKLGSGKTKARAGADCER